jgi:hypothetical protein
LKKRTKKLLSVAYSTALAALSGRLDAISQSFLFLFFKKEMLPVLPSFVGRPAQSGLPPHTAYTVFA